MDALTYLTSLSLLLLFGLLATLLSKKFRTSNVLLLVLFGLLLQSIFKETSVLSFPPIFISIVSIVALSIIVFDGASRFKLKEFDTFSFTALKLFFVFLLMNLLIITPLVHHLFNFNITSSIVFSTLMSATAFDVLSSLMKKRRNRSIELLELESLLNAPFVVLLPFIFIQLFTSNNISVLWTNPDYLVSFLQQVITGIGTGVLIGIIVFKLMRYKYSENLSPLALLTSVLLTYVLAESLQGNGVLAVTVLGLFFGNMYVKKKPLLQEFSSVMASSVEIIVFLLFGMLITLPSNIHFITNSILVFIVYLVVRFLSVVVSVPKYSMQEKLFMTFVMPKGITLAAVAITLLTINPDFSSMIDLLFLMFIYSLISSVIMIKMSKKWLKINVEKVIK